MKNVHKNTVKAQLRKGNKWEGYLAQNKVSVFHVASGFHFGCKVEVNTAEELEKAIQDFSLYNCNSELGSRVKLWEA